MRPADPHIAEAPASKHHTSARLTTRADKLAADTLGQSHLKNGSRLDFRR